MNRTELRERSLALEAETKAIAHGIRKRVLAKTIEMKGGNFSQACSSAELYATLYTRVLDLAEVEEPLMPHKFRGVPGPDNTEYTDGSRFHGKKGPHYDTFHLSPVQYSIVHYAALIEVGRMAPEAMDYYEVDGYDILQIGDASSPGMEFMAGSLGQTVSQAAGTAYARKQRGDAGRVVVLLGDGELQEGQTWETLEALAYYQLDNMLIFVDVNGHQVDGAVADTMAMDPLDEKLEAFGMRVIVVDGHDCNAIEAAGRAKSDGRPTVVLALTDSCRGAEVLRKRAPKLHFIRFSNEEQVEELQELLDSM